MDGVAPSIWDCSAGLPLAGGGYGPAAILTTHRELPLSERRMVLYTYSAPDVSPADPCNKMQVGDRVLAMAEQGGYAEAVAVCADQCYRLPPRMSFREAASLSLVYDTAWFALRERARLVPGETVLVLGASGGVGRAAVQLARTMGAHVLAGIARPERGPAVLAAGAHAVIDLSSKDLRG